jgi:hypothetical protein
MELSVRIERWPLAGAFTISRGTKTEAVVVVAELSDGTHRGRGESSLTHAMAKLRTVWLRRSKFCVRR